MITESKPKFVQLNLNTVLSGLVLGGIALLGNQFVDANRTLIRLQAQQEAMGKTLSELVPRAELELRFRAIEASVLEIRARQQSSDLEIIKLRDKR